MHYETGEPCPFTAVPDGPQASNLYVLWVQERNPDILSKSPGKRIPSRFPKGAAMERDTRLQVIVTSLLIYLFNVFFGVHSNGAFPPGPPHRVPSDKDVPFLEPSFIHHSKSPVYEPRPDSRFTSNVKGPLWREILVTGTFLNISSWVPSKGAFPRETLHS